MISDIPDDADGDAIHRVQANGADLSRPMQIDFCVAVPDALKGQAFAIAAEKLGYVTELDQDTETQSWTFYCAKTEYLTHSFVVSAQSELDRLAEPFGGYADGWGTFGNVT